MGHESYTSLPSEFWEKYRQLRASGQYIREIRETFAEKAWIGPDLNLVQDTVIEGDHAWIPVLLTSQHLPYFEKYPQELLLTLKTATRSRAAQMGLDVDWQSTLENLISAYNPQMRKRLDAEESLFFPVLTINHSRQPIRIPKEMDYFVFIP